METDSSDGTQTTITQGPSGHNQILHVRQDSASELEALFNTALNPNFKSNSLPMKSRKLPESFFQQPNRPRGPPLHSHSQSVIGLVSSSISHSRSSSSDSSASHHSNLNHGMNNVNQNSSVTINQGVLGHRQSFTPGPAQRRIMSQNKTVPPSHNNVQQMPPIAHSRSKSLPVSLNVMNQNMMKTAQMQNSAGLVIPSDMPLPPNWEVARTPDDQIYYINHANRTTTWEDPRLLALKEQQQQQQQEERNTESSPHHSPMHSTNNLQNELLGPLPQGWEQAMTPQGEVYFINHETRSTSWLDPRRQQQGMNQQSSTASMNTQLQQQVHKMNQLDISQQQSSNFGSQPRLPTNIPPMMKQLTRDKDMLMKMRLLKQVGTGTGMDPFLGTASNYHERQRSGDSGVGGMGGNYSLPRTPEDYLGHVEEMDTGDVRNQTTSHPHQMNSNHSSNNQHQQNNQQQGFPDFLDTLPSSNVDFSANNISHSGSSEVLSAGDSVPTSNSGLTGEDPNINESDFMNDVESMLTPVKSENIDNLTWL